MLIRQITLNVGHLKTDQDKKPKYICFELFLMNDLKKRLPDIINYGIVKYSKKFNVYSDSIEKHLSDIVRNGHLKDDLFIKYYQTFIEDSASESYNHLVAKSENKAIGNYNYAKFYNDCCSYTQIYLALNDLELNHPNWHILRQKYNDIYDEVYTFECNYRKDSLVMLSRDMALDYLKSDKTHREWELLRGFLAIKSLQGNKIMVATHKADIVRRMTGAKSDQVMKHFLTDKVTKAASKKMHDKFAGRYFFDQLIKELFDRGFVPAKITPPGSRVTYFSTKLTPDELADEIVKFKTKQKSNYKSVEDLMKAKIANALKLVQV